MNISIKLRYIILGLVLFVSLFGMIYATHLHRHSVNKLYIITAKQQTLKAEHDRLLIEYSFITSPFQLEQSAVDKLDMKKPSNIDLVKIKIKN